MEFWSPHIRSKEQVPKTKNSTSSPGAVPLRNLTGSVQIFPKLSQILQSKANASLSTAATNAEKSIGTNSHAISARLGIVNGSLVYTLHVVDASNTIHRVIVDAGNGKVLSLQQVPFENQLHGRGGEQGMFAHPRGGTFTHPGFLRHFGGM